MGYRRSKVLGDGRPSGWGRAERQVERGYPEWRWPALCEKPLTPALTTLPLQLVSRSKRPAASGASWALRSMPAMGGPLRKAAYANYSETTGGGPISVSS